MSARNLAMALLQRLCVGAQGSEFGVGVPGGRRGMGVCVNRDKCRAGVHVCSARGRWLCDREDRIVPKEPLGFLFSLRRRNK